MTDDNKTGHKKEIFKTGEYVQHFTPDDKWNPFYKIYKQKKEDTINIINSMNNSKTILDVGGGMGRLSLALAQSGKSRVVLTDISTDMLKLVQRDAGNNGKVEVVNADAHHLPYPNGFFDIVVGLDLGCHLVQPELALSEFHRVLKDDGTLILDSTNSNPLWTLFYPRYLGKNPINWFKVMKFDGILPGWENIVKHYPRETFYSLLRKMGFNIIQNLNYGPAICPKWHLAVSKKSK